MRYLLALAILFSFLTWLETRRIRKLLAAKEARSCLHASTTIKVHPGEPVRPVQMVTLDAFGRPFSRAREGAQ